MKLRLLPLLLAVLLLFGCGVPYPEQDLAGNPWDDSWTILGVFLGVENPGDGFKELDRNYALTAADAFVSNWRDGEPIKTTNANGETETHYRRGIALTAVGSANAEAAELNMQDWLAFAQEAYVISETTTETYNGQEYIVLTYTYPPETSPYDRGVSALTVFEHYAISVEVLCGPEYEGSAKDVMTHFLQGCHLSAEQLKR